MQVMEELDEIRTRLLAIVRAHPESVREATRAPGGGWTPTQVLQHLYLVEALMLAGLEAQPTGSADRSAGQPAGGSENRPASRGTRSLRHRLGGLAVHLVFRLGLRVRMPTHRVNPEPPLPFSEVEERWVPVARKLRSRLEEARVSAPGAPVMRHPVSGPLDPDEAASFLLKHMRHHEAQLQRILVPARTTAFQPANPTPSERGERESPPTA